MSDPNDKSEPEREKDMDYIFESIVGGNGWWQWKTTFILFPLTWISGYPLFMSIFAAYTPPHRCYVEGCDEGLKGSGMNASFLDFSVPREHASSNIFTEADDFDPCHKYATFSPPPLAADNGYCSAGNFDSNKSVSCDRFVYDHSQMESTLSTELDLVCESDYQRRLLGTLLMVGLFLGSIIGGYIGDKIGRKKAMFVGAIAIIPSVIIAGYVPNYYVYAVLRVVVCTALPIMWIGSTSYGLEYFSPDARRLLICVRDIPIHQYVLILIVYFNRDWTNLHLWTGILCLFGLPVWFLVPESPRWLAGNNKKDEAMDVFLDIAKTNGRTVTSEQKAEIHQILSKVDKQEEGSLNPLDMFRSEHIIKTLILLLNWVTVCVGYYALTLNSTSLNGHIVMNYLLATIADTPVFIFLYFTLDGIGRRYTMAFSQVTLGLCCIVLAFSPKHMDGLILVFYLLGKAAAGVSFLMVWLVTAELFPTNLRSQAIGLCSMVARVFGLTASFVSKLAVYWTPLPMLILGVPTVLAGGLALLLTETSGQDLPTTLEDAKNMQEKQKKLNNNDIAMT